LVDTKGVNPENPTLCGEAKVYQGPI